MHQTCRRVQVQIEVAYTTQKWRLCKEHSQCTKLVHSVCAQLLQLVCIQCVLQLFAELRVWTHFFQKILYFQCFTCSPLKSRLFYIFILYLESPRRGTQDGVPTYAYYGG